MAIGWWLTANDPVLAIYWPGATSLSDDELAPLLASAQIQCEAYAPALDDAVMVPDNYRHGQALQARALYRSGIAGSGDQIGMDGMAVTVFPMDWTVKALLRPRRGVPRPK